MIEWLRSVFGHPARKADPAVRKLVVDAAAQTPKVKAAVKAAHDVSSSIFEDFQRQDGFFKGAHR